MLILDIYRTLWYRIFTMIEDTQTPQTNNETLEERQEDAAFAARAAQRLESVGQPPNNISRNLAVAATVGALAFGAVSIGQALSNEAKHDDRVAAVTGEYQHNQDVLKDIQNKAVDPVDPASIVGIFNVSEGKTVNQLSIDIVDGQPEYTQADQATKEWIDFTILESGKAQGSYDVGDTFVVSQTEIDGKKTLIVQDGNDVHPPSP